MICFYNVWVSELILKCLSALGDFSDESILRNFKNLCGSLNAITCWHVVKAIDNEGFVLEINPYSSSKSLSSQLLCPEVLGRPACIEIYFTLKYTLKFLLLALVIFQYKTLFIYTSYFPLCTVVLR